MVPVVVKSAEPSHLKWLQIVIVMGVEALVRPAYFAWLPLQIAIAKRIAYSCLCAIGRWISLPPFGGNLRP